MVTVCRAAVPLNREASHGAEADEDAELREWERGVVVRGVTWTCRSLVTVAVALMSVGTTTPALDAQEPPDVLSRIRVYIDRFQHELPSLVAEEQYLQTLTIGTTESDRVLRSDVLMISVPGTVGWVSFRDVFEVDGRQIRDREDRLLKLLQSPGADGLAQARKLAEESARFNMGRVKRTDRKSVV